MIGPASQTTNGWSVPAMQPPLSIGENLGLDQLRSVRVEESAQGLDDRLFWVRNPTFADKFFQAVRQGIRAFDAKRFHTP